MKNVVKQRKISWNERNFVYYYIDHDYRSLRYWIPPLVSWGIFAMITNPKTLEACYQKRLELRRKQHKDFYRKLCDKAVFAIQKRYEIKEEKKRAQVERKIMKQMKAELDNRKRKDAGKELKEVPSVRELTPSQLKEKLLKILQKYARLRDSDEYGYGNCISCGKSEHYKQANGWHFISRAKNQTAFCVWNINFQCVHCNNHLNGNVKEYENAMNMKYPDWKKRLLVSCEYNEKLDPLRLKAQINVWSKKVRELEATKIPLS